MSRVLAVAPAGEKLWSLVEDVVESGASTSSYLWCCLDESGR